MYTLRPMGGIAVGDYCFDKKLKSYFRIARLNPKNALQAIDDDNNIHEYLDIEVIRRQRREW